MLPFHRGRKIEGQQLWNTLVSTTIATRGQPDLVDALHQWCSRKNKEWETSVSSGTERTWTIRCWFIIWNNLAISPVGIDPQLLAVDNGILKGGLVTLVGSTLARLSGCWMPAAKHNVGWVNWVMLKACAGPAIPGGGLYSSKRKQSDRKHCLLFCTSILYFHVSSYFPAMLTVPTCLGGTLQMLAIMLLLCFAPMFTLVIIIMVTQHITTMTKSHHGGEMSVRMKVGICQCQKSTIHHTPCWIIFWSIYICLTVNLLWLNWWNFQLC